MKKIYLMGPEKIGTISPEIYGSFSEHIGGVIYDGIWVGEDSKIPNIKGFRREIIDRLRAIKMPMMRWPGGCFAETYDWRDGIGPRAERPKRINWWTRWDGRYEPNEVGTHEFIDFCRAADMEPYFAANITTTTPLDIRDWIDYCNSPAGTTSLAEQRAKNGAEQPFNVEWWGVGNETWGGGGNMTPTVYAHEFRRYSIIMNNTCPGLVLIGSGANGGTWKWTHDFMHEFETSEKHMQGFSLHYYCGKSGDPLTFSAAEWYQMMHQAEKMAGIVDRHWDIIKGFGMEKYARLVVDEWGCWHPDGSGPSKGYNLFEQQSTMRDAMVSALTLNIFNNRCDRVMAAAVAQLVNNLHALFLSGGEHCITTPTYHVFDMFKEHMGGEAMRCAVEGGEEQYRFISPKDGTEKSCSTLSVSASRKNGKVTVTIANPSASEDVAVELCPVGFGFAEGDAAIATLADEDLHAHNTFEDPERVVPVHTSASPKIVTIPRGGIVRIEAATV